MPSLTIKIQLKSLIGILFLFNSNQVISAENCSYNSYTWNSNAGIATDFKRIEKLRSELTPSEIDTYTGCSVCEQDQIIIKITSLPPFKACHRLAKPIKNVITNLLTQGENISSVVGYRVGKTKGSLDINGLRTQFSNHSFGIAIDINSAENGLYDNCLQFNSDCRLIKGGEWKTGSPGALNKNSPTVYGFKNIGLKWGGEIKGKQKDFMHFSPTGY